MPGQNVLLERSGSDSHGGYIVFIDFLEISEETANAVGALLLEYGVT